MNQEAMTDTPVPTKLELASRIARRTSLRDIKVRSINCSHSMNMFGPEVSETINLNFGHASQFEMTEPLLGEMQESEAPSHRRLFRASTRFQATGSRTDGQELFKIEAVFDLLYVIPGESLVEVEEAAAFADLNGVFNSWSYWRELVSSLTMRMGFTGIIIPLHRPIV